MKSIINFLRFAFLEKEGRINRSAYVVAFCFLNTAISILLLSGYSLFLLSPDSGIIKISYIIFSLTVVLVQLYSSYNLNLKRAYDLNKTKLLAIFVTFSTAIIAVSALSASLFTLLFKSIPTIYSFLISTVAMGLFLLYVLYFIAVVILVFKKSYPEENEHGKSALENPALFEFSGLSAVILAIIFNSFVIYSIAIIPSNLENEIISKTVNIAETNWTAEDEDLDAYVEEYFIEISFIEDDEKLSNAKRKLKNNLSLKQDELKIEEAAK